MTVTIWHNPACGTSRNTLAMIRAGGIAPAVIDYLKDPPPRAELARVAAAVGGVRALLRRKGTPYDELGLGDASLSDDALLDAMQAHPILIERPVVIAGGRIALCRPSERVLALIGPLAADFVKEDGERVAGLGG